MDSCTHIETRLYQEILCSSESVRVLCPTHSKVLDLFCRQIIFWVFGLYVHCLGLHPCSWLVCDVLLSRQLLQ